MTRACDIDAGWLVDADKRRYANVSNNINQQLSAVEMMFKEAKKERALLIREVQLRYPGLINTEGRFEEDLLAERFAAEDQLELELVVPEKEAAPKEKPSAKKTKQDGDTEPSPGGVAEGEQAGGAKKTASRAADLKKPRPPKKDKGTGDAGLKAKGTRRATKKSAKAAPKSEPVVEREEVKAEREVEQPPAVAKETSRASSDTILSETAARRLSASDAWDAIALVTSNTVEPYAPAYNKIGSNKKTWDNFWAAATAKGSTLTRSDALKQIEKLYPQRFDELRKKRAKISAPTPTPSRVVLKDTDPDAVREKLSQPKAVQAFSDMVEFGEGKEFNDGVTGILETVFITGLVSNSAARKQATDLVNTSSSILWDNAERVDEIFVDLIVAQGKAYFTQNGQLTPWAKLAIRRGLIKDINDLSSPDLPPDSTVKKMSEANLAAHTYILVAIGPTDTNGVMKDVGDGPNIATRTLKDTINTIDLISGANSHVSMQYGLTEENKDQFDARLRGLIQNGASEELVEVNEGATALGSGSRDGVDYEASGYGAQLDKPVLPDMEDTHEGVPLSEWFLNGRPKWEKFGRKWVLVRPKGVDVPAARLALEMSEGPSGRGKVFKLDGTPITKHVPHGRVSVLVARAMRKFSPSLRPKWRVFKNLADLKRRDNALWREAMASRDDILSRRLDGLAPKDIPENAAGYAFGNKIIIFSDNVATEQELSFTIAHEVVGHLGLAALMTKTNFRKMLDEIYEQDGQVRREALKYMDLMGLSQQEATEEALADLAGELEISIVKRISDAIRNFLNKLGLTFDDDMTRYFIHQSRRYVRTGVAPVTSDASPSAVFAGLEYLERRGIEGRASQASVAEMAIMSRGSPWMATQEQGIRFRTSMRGLKLTGQAWLGRIGDWVENVQTLNNLAIRSPGLGKLMEFFRKQGEHVHAVKADLEQRTELLHRVSVAGLGSGLTNEEKFQVGQLLAQWRLHMQDKIADEKILDTIGNLVDIDKDGNKIPDDENIKAAIKFAAPKDRTVFTEGTGKTKGIRIRKADNMGNYLKGDEVEFWTPDFKITDKVWEAFEQTQDGIAGAAIHVLNGKLDGNTSQKQTELQFIGAASKELQEEDIETIRQIAEIYAEIYNKHASLDGSGFKWDTDAAAAERGDTKDSELARVFVHQALRVLHADFGAQKVRDWEHGSDKAGDELLVELVKNDKIKKLIPQLKALSNRNLPEGGKGSIAAVDKAIKDMLLLDNQLVNAQYWAKKTIMGAYVPIKRDGKFQVMIQVLDDKTNAPVELAEGLTQTIFYARTDSEVTAKLMQEQLRDIYKGTMELGVMVEGEVKPTKVRFSVAYSEGSTVPPLGESIDYDEFTRALIRDGINLTPQERQRVVESLARHHSAARSGLNFTGNPGWDPNMIARVAEHLELQAHIAGKNKFSHQVSDTLSKRNDALWLGDKDMLDAKLALYEKALKTGNLDEQHLAQQNYLSYAHQYIESSPSAEPVEIRMPNGDMKKFIGKNKGERYRNRGVALVEFHNHSRDIVDTLDSRFDQLSAPLMEVTAVSQLGLSVATSMVNLASLGTHAIPWLATYNRKTGYGGGFGMVKASLEITRAAKDMNLISRKLTTAKGLRDMIDDGSWVRHGFQSIDEAEFLLEQTVNGVTAPALANTLTGTARAGRYRNWRTAGTRGMMLMFTSTERFNRRVTVLAAYRLQKQRMINSGTATEADFNNPKSKASINLSEFAVRAVNTSQGDYAMYNRPPWARGGIGKLLYTYKQFVVISIELMRNLAFKERVAFLSMLFLLSGIKGLPFADDLLDVIDTLKQKFGIKARDMEVVIADIAESIIPGLKPGAASAIALRGLFDYVLGATGSTRFGQGDLIPGSGIAKYGSNVEREFTNIAGPVASAVKAILGSGALLAQYVAESVGMRPDTIEFKDFLRTGGGVGAIKAFVEGFIYMNDGSITTDDGKIVAKNISAWGVMTRMMGFYPGDATAANAVIRLGKAQGDYTKEIKAGFVDRARRARAAKNHREVGRVRRDVRDWNQAVGRKSPLFLRNFDSSLNKALKDAKLTAPARYLKSAPKSNKEFTKHVMRLYGFDPRGVPLD